MSDEDLSRRDDRRLHRALESVVLTQFPNPARINCPQPDILQALARKRLPMRHAAFEHVGKCSPCFTDVRNIRRGLRRARIFWMSAISAVLIAVVAVSYVAFRQSQQTVPDVFASGQYQAMSLDLRPYSVSRGGSPSSGTTAPEPLRLGKALLNLVMFLPVGAEEGPYEFEIQKNGAAVLASAIGTAQIENHITTLRINVDTRTLRTGDYQLALRQMGLNWTVYPLTID